MGLFDDLQGTAPGRVDGKKSKLQVIDGGAVDDRRAVSEGRKAATKTGKTGTKTRKSRTENQTGPGAGVVGRVSVVSDAGESGAGDVVTASGVDASLLPASVDDVIRLLPVWLSDWVTDSNIQDVRKVSPLVFGGFCMRVGREYIKPSGILKDHIKRARAGYMGNGGACNAYNPAAVLALFYVFKQLCHDCDKIPFSSDFADFCGCSLSYIRGYGDKLTSLGLEVGKKIHSEELEAVRRSAARDPVGRLAILNNEYWGGGSSSGDSVSVQAVDSIPAAASFGLLPGGGLD